MTKQVIRAIVSDGRVVTEKSTEATELFEQSRFGSQLKDGRLELSYIEAIYLVEKERLEVADSKGKFVKHEKLFSKAARKEKNFWPRYYTFKDIRDRGYIIKTALKFGADFRVYDRGVKPGEDHAKWIVYPVRETEHLTWYEFAAKNRVAHSTKKRLLMAIVDEEGDVTYYEVRWVRP
ncbi:MAG: tRNA-intron lyase [Nanoarchaeota archaeon]